MAFPPPELCIDMPDIPSIDDICFPGGFCLSYVWDSINKIPTAADMSMDFFSISKTTDPPVYWTSSALARKSNPVLLVS